MKKPTKKRPRDISQLAASIVKEATEEKSSEDQPEENPTETKNPNAVALGRLGGLKGGPARKKILSETRRIEIARNAAQARWNKNNK